MANVIENIVANMQRKCRYDYDYYLVNEETYKGFSKEVPIICKEHGVFYMSPKKIIRGYCCPLCDNSFNDNSEVSSNKIRKEIEDKYKNIYIVKNVSIKGNISKVSFICKEHGQFQATITPNTQYTICCPYCAKKSKSWGEEVVMMYLHEKNIVFFKEYRLNDFLVDFFIPSRNTIIEYNGLQHYKPVEHFGGQESFIKQQERDMTLRQYCKEHNIRLIEIPYTIYNKYDIKQYLAKEMAKS